MVKINDTTTLPNTTPALTDHVPGTDVSNTTNDANGETVTFTLQAILDLYAGGVGVFKFDAGGSSSAARPTSIGGITVGATDIVIWYNHGSSEPTNAQSQDLIAGPGTGVVYVNTQTGTTYTLVLGDAGKAVDMNNASANTLTIPTNASVAFAVGTCISVTQLGAGTTTVQGDTGVTVNGSSAGSVAINNQYAGVTIRKTATNTWIAQGDFT